MRSRIIYAVAIFLEFIVLVNLIDVVRSSVAKTLSPADSFMRGSLLVGVALMIGAAAYYLVNLRKKEWGGLVHSLGIFWAEHRWGLLSCLGLSTLGFLSMGLPGLLLIECYEAIVLLRKSMIPMSGDSVWPLGIVYSIGVPWIAFGFYLVLRRYRRLSVRLAAFAAFGVTLIGLLCFHFVIRFLNII